MSPAWNTQTYHSLKTTVKNAGILKLVNTYLSMEESKPLMMFATHICIHPSFYLLLGMGVTAACGHSICTAHPTFSFVLGRTEMARTPYWEDRCYSKWQEELGLGAVLKRKVSYLYRAGMGIYGNKWNNQKVWKHFPSWATITNYKLSYECRIFFFITKKYIYISFTISTYKFHIYMHSIHYWKCIAPTQTHAPLYHIRLL